MCSLITFMHEDLKRQKKKVSSVILEDKGVLLNSFSTVWAPSRESTAAFSSSSTISSLNLFLSSTVCIRSLSWEFLVLDWTAYTGQTSSLLPVNGIVLPLCHKSQLQMFHQRGTPTSILP